MMRYGQLPDLPIIRNLQTEMEQLTATIREKENTLSQIERNGIEVDNRALQSANFGTLQESSIKRRASEQAVAQIEREIVAARARIAQCQDEVEQWSDKLNRILDTKRRLYHRLAEPQSEDDRLALQQELLALLQTLARFSGDDSNAKAITELDREIRDKLPYVELQNNYVQLGNGEIILESEMQERAIRLGADVVGRGARNSKYKRGARIDKAEVKKLGLI